MTAEFVTALLVNSAVFSALAGGLLLVRKLLGKRLSAALRYALWAAVVIKLLLPFGFESGLSPLAWFPKAVPAHAVVQNLPPAEAEPPLADPAPYAPAAKIPGTDLVPPQNAANEPALPATPQQAAPQTPAIRLGWADWAAIVWALGATATGAWLLLCMALVRKRMLRNGAAASRRVMSIAEGCKKELGIRRAVGIRLCKAAGVPAIAGVVRPTIILPADADKYGDATLRHILLHELAHYRCGHLPVIQLMNLLIAVYWFNPLAWLCFRLIRGDMETICDQQVLRLVGHEQQHGYVRTVLQFSSAPDAGSLRAALAMSAGRAHMERRIRGMFRRRRSGAGARVAAVLVALAMLASGILTACQPSPTKPVVVNKGDGKLDEAIKATAEPHAMGGPQGTGGAPAPTSAPKKYTDSFKGADGGVTINIDAEVAGPATAMPVVEVKPRIIDMEQIKAMANVLFRGNTAYEPKVARSKSDLEEEILKLQKHISDDKALLEYYGGDRKAANEVKKEFQQRIAAYQQQMANAPDTAERKETDWTFRPYSYYIDMVAFGTGLDGTDDDTQRIKQLYYDSRMIQLDADVEGYHARLEVMNLDTDQLAQHYVNFYLGSGLDGLNTPEWNEADAKPMTMTRAEAVAMASEALAQMGLGHMRLNTCFAYGKLTIPSGVNNPDDPQAALKAAMGEGMQPQQGNADETGEDVYKYAMSFVSTYEGVAEAPMSSKIIENIKGGYAASYSYERMDITVCNGIITSLSWYGPVEQTGVENANVKLLPFDDVLAAFKRQMQLEYTLARLSRYSPENPDYEEYIGKIESGEINITDIQIGLARIAVKDRPGVYRMMPVWMFSGTEKLNMKNAEQQAPGPLGQQRPARMPGTALEDYTVTYEIINAVDGSVINSEGY